MIRSRRNLPPQEVASAGSMELASHTAVVNSVALRDMSNRLPDIEALYRSSIVITGAHYSMTTLIESLLSLSPAFDHVSEMFKWEQWIRHPTLVVDGWYPYYDGARYAEFRDRLQAVIAGSGIADEIARRVPVIRTPRDVAHMAQFTFDQIRRRLKPKPTIFKEPFAALTAPVMQKVDGLRVILGVRHPCAWVESAMRRDGGFDVRHFDKPETLAAVPDFADEIVRLSRRGGSPIETTILTWRLLFTYHARHLLGDPRTLVCRQEDLVAAPRVEAERLFAFAEVPVPDGLDAALAANLAREGKVDWEEGQGQYTRRNANEVVGKWRTRLSAAQVAEVRRATESVAARFGYDSASWDV